MDVKTSNSSSKIDQKIQNYTLIRNLIFYLFMGVVLVNIGIYFFFNTYLPLKYPIFFAYFIYIFFIAGIINQRYLYLLFKKTGKGVEFLKKRSVVLGTVLALFIVGLLFIELY